MELRGLKSGSFDQVQVDVVNQSLHQEQERLFELVVGLSRDVIVLKVSLSVESDLSGLDFSVFSIDLVADEDHRNILTDSGEILVPFGDVLVGDSGSDIEHDDGTVSTNIVTFSESSELFLTSGIPNVEFDGSVVGEESQSADFDTLGGDIFLLELTSQMSLDESGFTDTTITDKDELVFSDVLDATLLTHTTEVTSCIAEHLF